MLRPPFFCPVMTLPDKLALIARRRRVGMRPGLERIQLLLDAMGHPERELVCIHIAGSNGKGSTAAMIAAVLKHAKLSDIGLYTSPHLIKFNERIRINGEPISDAALEAAIDEALEADNGEATFFELATATAFAAFRAAGVRLAVIEAGLGGRLDATNVVIPVLSVITNISLEHCQWLGNDIHSIACEKAGIVKPGRPVVIGAMPPEAATAIAHKAAECGAPFVVAEAGISSRKLKGKELVTIETGSRSISGIRFALSGAYQKINLATAVTALEVFSETTSIAIEDNAFKAGLENVSWPCRCQMVREDPLTILDGAHNPGAATALAQSLSDIKKPLALVAGFCADKDVLGCLRALKPQFAVAFATETPNDRTLPASECAVLMRQVGLPVNCVERDWQHALAHATAWATTHDGGIVVCGSLFLAGAAASAFGILPPSTSGMPNESLAPAHHSGTNEA